MLDAYKELTPVVYGESAIKYMYTTFASEGNCFRPHWHDRMELLQIVSGEMHLRLDEECRCAKQGDTVLIGPRTLHFAVAGPEGVTYHVAMFDVEKFFNTTAASEKYVVPLYNPEIRFGTVSSQPELVAAVDRLMHFLPNAKDENSLFAISAIYEIIGALYKYCSRDFRPIQKKDESFREILEYMNAHYASQLSVKDISKHFNYNETYFCRRFKAVTGMTVMKYIQSLRMEKAQKLLKSSSEEIGTIAWKCGFSDLCYFSNCFKKEFGCTPTDFRNRHK